MDWNFSTGISYGVALGLLLAILALNVVGEIWPVDSVIACFADPPGHAVSTIAHF